MHCNACPELAWRLTLSIVCYEYRVTGSGLNGMSGKPAARATTSRAHTVYIQFLVTGVFEHKEALLDRVLLAKLP